MLDMTLEIDGATDAMPFSCNGKNYRRGKTNPKEIINEVSVLDLNLPMSMESGSSIVWPLAAIMAVTKISQGSMTLPKSSHFSII